MYCCWPLLFVICIAIFFSAVCLDVTVGCLCRSQFLLSKLDIQDDGAESQNGEVKLPEQDERNFVQWLINSLLPDWLSCKNVTLFISSRYKWSRLDKCACCGLGAIPCSEASKQRIVWNICGFLKAPLCIRLQFCLWLQVGVGVKGDSKARGKAQWSNAALTCARWIRALQATRGTGIISLLPLSQETTNRTGNSV